MHCEYAKDARYVKEVELRNAMPKIGGCIKTAKKYKEAATRFFFSPSKSRHLLKL